ncbi:ROK family transcriptional regulator [Streptosporangium roseum]|uniref:Transcriptional regulator ROK family n=1 Tax=Streptosporangium roseum (strain ATCC 12428 / DSM 43021 / JCM 3005 / KCTC 9067 / NCIMB 10171 / NRRL 2505 / NI 9100) TaxID=479432 RepID=D2BFC7_STRRD|nr:ROK family transcriptional regulator [Streptosporangium roseum]ACZ88285.1 transcriptional regulator ROK family [Streptosporangium roseum DSM 43021]
MSSGSPRVLRTLNERATLELLLRSGPLTRGELESLTGLSKASAAEVLRRLESARLVKKGGRKPGSAGPAAHMWALDGSCCHVAGVDVTPDALDVAVADLTGQVVGEHRMATPGIHDPMGSLAVAVAEAARAAGLRTTDLDQIVVGMPGVIDVVGDRLDSVIQLPSWEHVHDLSPLRARLGNDRVRMENDVNLVAVEEMVKGSARDAESFALFWLGRGIGAGVVLNGALLRGATGRGGEIGSIVVPDPAERGRVLGPEGGSLDSILGAEAVLRLARAHGLAAGTGSGGPAADSAVSGAADAVSRAVADGSTGFLEALAARMAVGVIALVGVLDPHLVVLGGSLCAAGGEELRRMVAVRLATTALARTPLVLSAVSGNAVRAGAVEFALGIAREQVFKAGTAGR